MIAVTRIIILAADLLTFSAMASSVALKRHSDLLRSMFLSVRRLPHPIPAADKPDPKAAQALQEGLGGQFGEMRTMMQYFFQYMNFRGDAKPYQDLLRSIATEEMGHFEQVANTINTLLEGASPTSQQPNDLPLSVALDSPNIHHFLVAAQSARPVDAAGNP
jgi:Mn-containing catalase